MYPNNYKVKPIQNPKFDMQTICVATIKSNIFFKLGITVKK